MKRMLAGLAAFALLAAAFWLGDAPQAKRTESARAPQRDRPQACIDRLFAAAEQADVDAYLACFAEPERSQLQREVDRVGSPQFARSLSQATRALKAFAVIDETDEQNPDRAQLLVERVYQHHHEKQRYRLKCFDGQWQITEILPADKLQPPVPYGTPVVSITAELPPERN